MNMNDLFGHMPPSNLRTSEDATASMCCMNLTNACLGDHCMAWRWLRRGDKPVMATDDDGHEVGVGWCGLAAWPDIGNAAD